MPNEVRIETADLTRAELAQLLRLLFAEHTRERARVRVPRRLSALRMDGHMPLPRDGRPSQALCGAQRAGFPVEPRPVRGSASQSLE